MDLDQLQSVRDRERQTDRLQQLRESFYEDAAAFVADLRAERDEAAAAAQDPFDSPQVSRLTDRIRTAEQTLEAIYEKRVGKVVKAATFAAADLPAEAEGMTKEEAELFETLVDEIEANRAEVLGRLSADDGDAVEPANAAEDATATDGPGDGDTGDNDIGDVGAADVMGGEPPEDRGTDVDGVARDDAGTDPTVPVDDELSERGSPPRSGEDEPSDGESDATTDSPDATDSSDATDSPDAADSTADDGAGSTAGDDAADVERELVRITDDVGPILGVDEREYDLATDDVVTLPAENARPLVERGAAERLE